MADDDGCNTLVSKIQPFSLQPGNKANQPRQLPLGHGECAAPETSLNMVQSDLSTWFDQGTSYDSLFDGSWFGIPHLCVGSWYKVYCFGTKSKRLVSRK